MEMNSYLKYWFALQKRKHMKTVTLYPRKKIKVLSWCILFLVFMTLFQNIGFSTCVYIHSYCKYFSELCILLTAYVPILRASLPRTHTIEFNV